MNPPVQREPFTCHACGQTIQPASDTMATGYAVERLVDADGSHERKICYECARKHDLEQAAKTGQLFAYASGHDAIGEWKRYPRPFYINAVKTWPGLSLSIGRVVSVNTWRSNFGDVRTAFTCSLPTGESNGGTLRKLEKWHGIAYAGNGGYCRLRRAKIQRPPYDAQG